MTSFSQSKAASFLHHFHSINAIRLVESYQKENISVLTLFDEKYPTYLKHISQPPVVLFCKGDTNLLQNKKNLSVVGTRKPSSYGLQVVEKILKPLTPDWVIVSGLAKGIDGKAHKVAVENKGRTIAVIAGGFHHIYPREHISLASEIAKNHLLLSVHPPNTRPQKWMFPERNQLISGLSLGTLVVQAAKQSGSLITAQYALDEGREVFTVPCQLFDERFIGNVDLMKDGATVIFSPEDIERFLQPMLK
ncbi:DNA-processing protein DprA [Bacillus sp. FJAT-47783]|uniref:DNA-processing protein DprA n=1 Tax=Bacillus sp. FJAT-47783 TaxID=2922712 RepID=UPI001FAD9623|nr:DNA-processing protein DprA [Bacillus sp. FJAT-47783]